MDHLMESASLTALVVTLGLIATAPLWLGMLMFKV